MGRRRAAWVCVALAAAVGGGCAGEFDTSRATPPRGSLGREMYTLVCDRVGAQALREDVTGASFHAVCHAGADGGFADAVDTSKLPPLDPGARDVSGEPVPIELQRARRAHRVARIEALARRRDDLVTAFDRALTGEAVGTKDLDNPDPAASCGPSPGKVSEAPVEKALGDMLGRLTPLYEDDTIPHLTRALSRVMNEVERAPEAQAALARFDARRGYRPPAVAMGVSRPLLSYPRLVDLANALLRLLATSGPAHPALVSLMAASHEELRAAKESPSFEPLEAVPDPRDPRVARLSRPRGSLEIARTLLLHQDAAFSAGEPRFIVARDARGVAKVALQNGRVPSPFVDATGDGLADVDDLGRFVTKGGAAPQPFRDFYGEGAKVTRDAAGRSAAFEYVDASSTWLAALARDLVPMLEPDPSREHETLMDLFSGLVLVAGARDDGPNSERAYPGEGGDVTLRYRGYRKDASPLLDLVHGVGQVLAAPTTDDTLALFAQLVADHPDVLARLVGAGLEVKAIADAHPEAHIPESSTLWDEIFDVLVLIAQKPALVEDVIRAFGDPGTLDLPRSAVAYMTMRDDITYDRNDLNGSPFNRTTGKVEPMKTMVDRSAPDTGANRSAFQRFLAALHETKDMSVCNKEGAVAHIKWNGVSIDFPSFAAQAACFTLGADPPPSPMPMCGMLRIKNISQDLVDAVLGTVNLDIRDDCMKKLVSSPLTGIVGGADAFLEDVSGIRGFTTKPTVPAISRLVYFDLPYPGHEGDTQNGKTRTFLKDLFDIVPTLDCPALPFTDTDGVKLNLRQCQTFQGTLRQRDPDALFPLEQFGFLESAKPLARAFQKSEANLLFVELFDVLHRHWGSDRQSKEECDPTRPRSSSRWCAHDGASSYEPLVAEALSGDLFPALHDSVKELEKIVVQHCEARDAKGACTKTTAWDGVKVLAEAVKAMVDPAKNKGLRRRDGDASVVRNDGTKNPQVTPLYLVVDALRGFDASFEGRPDRLGRWRRARSQIVDQLFSVDGKGAASRFANDAVAKMLPVLVRTLREQVAAHCPDPAKGCGWARAELPKNFEEIVTGPTFAGVMDVLDAVVADEPARTELERLLVFLLRSGEADAHASMLASLVDLLQVLEDDANMTALLHAAADAAGPEVVDPEGRIAERGMLLSAVEVLARVLGEVHADDGARLCSKEIDPDRTLAVVLRRLVALPEDGGPPPIEVLIDVAADVNRADPTLTTKLEPHDYASIAHEVSDFCTHPSRGLEQVYQLIKQAMKDP